MTPGHAGPTPPAGHRTCLSTAPVGGVLQRLPALTLLPQRGPSACAVGPRCRVPAVRMPRPPASAYATGNRRVSGSGDFAAGSLRPRLPFLPLCSAMTTISASPLCCSEQGRLDGCMRAQVGNSIAGQPRQPAFYLTWHGMCCYSIFPVRHLHSPTILHVYVMWHCSFGVSL